MKILNFNISTIIILLSTVFSAGTIQSQTFVNPGAEWYFRGTLSGGHTFYIRWRYEEDVSINGLIYQKISREQKNVWGGIGAPPIVIVNLDPFLYRSAGDSLLVSEINGSNEKLLYDFTPQIGNSWDVTPLVTWYTVEPTSPLLIETIAFGDTIINGVLVNWIDVENNNPDTLVFSGRIYNHFGKEQMIPFWNDGTLDIEPTIWNCYRDDVLGEIVSSECYDYETLSVFEFPESEIKINPNYLERKIEIKCHNSDALKLVSISDLSGKMFTKNLKLNKDYIEFSQPEGIYILTLKQNEFTYTHKFFWSNKF